MLFFLTLTLFGCGGGGGGGASTPPGPTGTPPSVTAFVMPTTANSLTVSITTFTGSSDTTGYMVTSSATAPLATSDFWTSNAPLRFTFTGSGQQTAYAWVKNAAGLVSASMTAQVTLPATAKAVKGTVNKSDATNGDTPLSGVFVQAYPHGTAQIPANVTSFVAGVGNGQFTLTGLLAGQSYDLVFTRDGFQTLVYYNVSPDENNITQLGTFRMLLTPVVGPDDPPATADVNGYVRSAVSNQGSTVRVQFRTGIGATDTPLVPFTKSADSFGKYFQTLPAGVYTAQVVDTSVENGATLGYFTVYAFPGIDYCNNSQSFTVPTTSATATYRAVLTWGNTPADLDLHVTGPLPSWDTQTLLPDGITNRFHLDATSNRTYPYNSGNTLSFPVLPDASTYAFLDFDQSDHGHDNGPETITILKPVSGTYKFYVYNSTGSGLFSNSGAVVSIYKGATLLNSFTPPTGTGNTWFVCDLTGNTLHTDSVLSNVADTGLLAKRVTGSPLEEYIIFRHVVKKPRSI